MSNKATFANRVCTSIALSNDFHADQLLDE